MTAYEDACIEQGRLRERRRVFDLIARLELGECHCERWLTEMYAHDPTCDWNNEITYRSKLLVAITTPEAGLDGAEPSGHGQANDSSSASAAADALNEAPHGASATG